MRVQTPYKLDIKDKKILYQLDVNARQSFSVIGKKVGLSKDVVNYRIKQMEKHDIISGYYAVLDIGKLGYLNFRVFLKFKNTTPKKEAEIMAYLKNHPMVGWLVGVYGKWDSNMLVWVESPFKFQQFWREFTSIYKNYISKSWISIITELCHFRKSFLVGKKRDDSPSEVSGGETTIDVDETDLKILKVISDNARLPLLDIAKRTGASPNVVKYRLRQMLKRKVILSFRPLLNLSALGIHYYKVHLTLKETTKERENALHAYAKMNPNIILVDFNVGGADFEMEVYCYSNDEFYTIIDDVRQKFVDIIDDIETMRYYKEYKWNYMPK